MLTGAALCIAGVLAAAAAYPQSVDAVGSNADAVASALANAPASTLDVSGDVGTNVAATLADGATITSSVGSITVSLPGAVEPLVDRDGLRVSGSNSVSTDAGRIRVTTTLRQGDGPDIAYRLAVPAGVVAEPGADGGVEFVSQDGHAVIGRVEAPWAIDAAGKHLPTSFTLDGTTLTQHVDVHGAAFPVVTDPSFAFGRFVYVRLANWEVKAFVQAAVGGGAIAAGASVCVASGPGYLPCVAAFGGGAVLVDKYIDHSWKPNCGLEVKVTYPPQSLPVGVKNYKCT